MSQLPRCSTYYNRLSAYCYAYQAHFLMHVKAQLCSEVSTLDEEANSQPHVLVEVVKVHRGQCVVGSVEVRCRINHVLITDISCRETRVISSTATMLH